MITDYGASFCIMQDTFEVPANNPDAALNLALNKYMSHILGNGYLESLREEYVQAIARPDDTGPGFTFYFLRGEHPCISFIGNLRNVRDFISTKPPHGFFALNGDRCFVCMELRQVLSKYGPPLIYSIASQVQESFEPFNEKFPDIVFNLALLKGGRR